MTQAQQILQHLQKGHSITPLQALGLYRVYRLADVVYKLKARGHKVLTVMRTAPNGSTYAEYALDTRPSKDIPQVTHFEEEACAA